MQTSKKIVPESFVFINGIPYFRLKDGSIAVEKVTKVIINSSLDDNVELITLDCGSKEVNFWKIANKIYALASSSCLTIDKDTTFIDCYYSKNYPEGHYVKYMSSDKCGIIYVSETEVSSVISHEIGYKDICFENNVFYADLKEGKDGYHVIGESGRLLGTFSSKCRKLNGYVLFYDDNSIFINSTKFDIPGGILSVETIHTGKFTFVKVINNNGTYYYTENLEYLFGPIKNDDEISFNTDNSCFVFEREKDSKVIKKIFYIYLTNNSHIRHEVLTSQNGIGLYSFKMNGYSQELKHTLFFSADNVLYVLDEEKDNKFIPIIKDVDATRYIIHCKEYTGRGHIYSIVGYKDNDTPVYIADYDQVYGRIYGEFVIEKIEDGYKYDVTDGYEYSSAKESKPSHICKYKTENELYEAIFVIDCNGKVIISVRGNKCYKKKYASRDVYVIENSMGDIRIYSKKGAQLA